MFKAYVEATNMAESTEVVLLTETYNLSEIALPQNREKLISTLRDLESCKLNDIEVRKYFDVLKLAMGVFIHKVATLESDMLDLRKDQLAAEARMEALYLKAQLEIQTLKQEITEIRLSKGRINQIVKVAKALQGNAYAPYAIKSLVDGVVGGGVRDGDSDSVGSNLKLPSDFTNRLEFAQMHGFKWNQNNRAPAKATKQLRLLEEWEDQFCKVELLTIDQILDKRCITNLGPGAIAAALICLERELGYTLEDARKSFSVYNCYQKAIKLYHEMKSQPPTSDLDFQPLISELLPSLRSDEVGRLVSKLNSKNFTAYHQVLSYLRKIFSKKALPAFEYDQEHDTETAKLYALQSGHYDQTIESLIRKHIQI